MKSQTVPETIDLSGNVVKGKKAASGVVVTVMKNKYTQVNQLTTPASGKFSFQLPIGYDYDIKFSAPGCIDMFMSIVSKNFPRDIVDIYPEYVAKDVPLFDKTDESIRASKFTQAFDRVIWNGKKAFIQDEAYHQLFFSNVFYSDEEMAKNTLDKLNKEKAEKDKLAAAQKAKDDAEKARLLAQQQEQNKMSAEEKRRAEAAEAKRQAEEQAKADALAAAEQARLDAEAKQRKAMKESMETEAMRLKREAEARALAEKKNKDIKANQENDLLKIAAENERNSRQLAFANKKDVAEANTIIEKMKRDASRKGDAYALSEKQRLQQKKALENQLNKTTEVKKLVKAAAAAEKSIRMSRQKGVPALNKYTPRDAPNVMITESSGIFTQTRTTVISQCNHVDTYRKERNIFGSITCYKNDKEINEIIYNVEIAFYSSYATATN